MFVQQMQCLFSGSSRNLLAMQISFPVSFCQNSKFCQISLSVVSCLSLFSVEFLLTVSFLEIDQQIYYRILMHISLFSSGRQDVSTTFAYSQSVVLHVNSVVCQYLSIYKVFELLIENSLASKPNVWLARFDLLRQISYRVETLLESFLDYYWMKQFLSPSLFMCKCCFLTLGSEGTVISTTSQLGLF